MRTTEMIKIGANGEHLPNAACDHVAVLLPAEGLMFTRRPCERCRAPAGHARGGILGRIDVAGFHDWRMPDLDELQHHRSLP